MGKKRREKQEEGSQGAAKIPEEESRGKTADDLLPSRLRLSCKPGANVMFFANWRKHRREKRKLRERHAEALLQLKELFPELPEDELHGLADWVVDCAIREEESAEFRRDHNRRMDALLQMRYGI